MSEPGGGGGMAGVLSSGLHVEHPVNPVSSITLRSTMRDSFRTISGMAIVPPCIRPTERLIEPDSGEARNLTRRCHSSSSPFRAAAAAESTELLSFGWRQLESAFGGYQRVYRHVPRLAVYLQLEAVLEQRLQHEKHLVPAGIAIGLRVDS
jgi:hypothetical protein